jgi:hypothetical protein
MKAEPTIDCYVLVIGASDSGFKSIKNSMFFLRDIFKYNSLEDKTFSRQNDNMKSNSFEIQIPQFALQYLDNNNMKYIIKNYKMLIETKKRFISYRPMDNTWYINEKALHGNPL